MKIRHHRKWVMRKSWFNSSWTSYDVAEWDGVWKDFMKGRRRR